MELTLSLTPERGLSGCCLARIELSDKESLVVLLGGAGARQRFNSRMWEISVFRSYHLTRLFLEFPGHRLLVIDDRITHTIDDRQLQR
jgi:hypothetical protein